MKTLTKKRLACVWVVAAWMAAGGAFGAEITLEQAETAVGNWIARGGAFGRLSGGGEVSGETFVDPETGAKMHVVRVPGKGFVVTSADDGIEPVVLFSDGGGGVEFVAEEGNPLWDLLRWDLAGRAAAMAKEEKADAHVRAAAKGGARTARAKWEELLEEADGENTTGMGKKAYWGYGSYSIWDKRREPILATHWNQLEGYNLYTPGKFSVTTQIIQRTRGVLSAKDAGFGELVETNETGHCPVGCTATAAGQVMKYWAWPKSAKAGSFTCTVEYAGETNGRPMALTMMGGTYSWGNMGERAPTTGAQKKNVSHLLYDIGVACGADYRMKGTGISLPALASAMKGTFGYSSAVYHGGSTSGEALKSLLTPNLDAGCPVVMGITGRSSDGKALRHAVDVDGYGYSLLGAFYIHVNLGWGYQPQQQWFWYEPPDIAGDYTGIESFVCNIFPKKSGSILSGRVTGGNGRPVSGVAVDCGSGASTKTGKDGIYAFILGAGSYTVKAGDPSSVGFAEKSATVAATTASVNGNRVVDLQLPEVPTVQRIGWNLLGGPEVASLRAAKANDSGEVITGPVGVELECATAGAEIRYTLDGAQPGPESAVYEGALTIQDTTTLRAVAYADGMECSEEFQRTWTFNDPQSRDNFADARPISGASGKSSFNNAGYTKEAGEPTHSSEGKSGGASAWAKWTAPASGDWTFRLSGVYRDYPDDAMNTQLAVYTGTSASNLVRVAANDDANRNEEDYSSRLSFTAEGGTTYHIAMDSYLGTTYPGTLTLEWEEGWEDWVQFEYTPQWVPVSGGEWGMKVEATANWNVTDHSDWIEPVAYSGEAGGRIIYKVATNSTGSERTGYVTVQAGNSEFASLEVRQHTLDFVTTKDAALARAWRENKRILVIYGREACYYTSSTMFYTLPTAKVRTLLDEGFVLWYSNCDRQSDAYPFIAGFGGSTLPTLAIVDPLDLSGGVAGLGGYQTADAIQSLLQSAPEWGGLPPALAVATEELPPGMAGAGYQATLTATGGIPPYAWSVAVDAPRESAEAGTYAETGTAKGWQADDACWDLALPFAFPFLGHSYTNAKINSNGAISFGTGSFTAYSYSEATFKGAPIIAVLWKDLLTTGGDIHVRSGTDAVTVRWAGTYYGGGAVNFSATLHRSGKIVFSYGAGNAAGGVIGLSAGDGVTTVFSAKSDGGSMANARDIVFTQEEGLPPWLALSAGGKLTGTPPAGGKYRVPVRVRDSMEMTDSREFTLAVSGPQQVTTFKGNGGTPATQTTTNEVGAAYGTMPTPKWSGHVFLGWFTKASGGSQVAAGDKVTDAATRTLYAHWTDKQVVTFQGNGGTPSVQTATNTIYAKYGELPAAVRAGYVFQGWFNEAEGGKRVYTNSTVTLAAARTLYAQWEAIQSVAGDYYVDATAGNDANTGKSWTKAKASIQAAIDAAADGDRIVVHDGVYGPIATVDDERYPDGKELEIVSVNGAAKTIIDASASETMRAALLGLRSGQTGRPGGPQAILEGFTVRGGHPRSGSSPIGAGVLGGVLRKCIVTDNRAGGSAGGGVAFADCEGCTISGNRSTGWVGGGAFRCTLTDCIIEDNEALSGGGGVVDSRLVRCIVRRNKTADFGGGQLEGSAEDCLFVDNEAALGGGAAASATLLRCTVTGNRTDAAGAGGGAYRSVLHGSILWNNTAGGKTGNHCTESQGDYNDTVPLLSGPGNISANPMFLDAASGDFRLAEGSPCIDAGFGPAVAARKDLAGKRRWQGPGMDMGAYESANSSTPSFKAVALWVDAAKGSDSNTGTSRAEALATIQAAVDKAVDGATIRVLPGTYGPFSLRGRILTIRSTGGAARTIVDGGGMSRCAWLGIGTDAVLEGFTLMNGHVSVDGGGVWGGSLRDCVIRDNTADQNGGGALLARLERCQLLGNTAKEGDGGGAYLCDLANCLVHGNSAVTGGGIWGYGNVAANCTIAGNSATEEGGGAMGAGSVRNCIFWDNSAPATADLPEQYGLEIRSCFVQTHGGSATGNPLFADAASGDYRLRAGSPCIDAGENALAEGDQDLAGNARICGTAVDIGAYEQHGEVLVRLDAQGGNGGTPYVMALPGTAMPDIAVPERASHAFEGYFTKTNGAGKQYYTPAGAGACVCDIAADTTLHAYWHRFQSVEFDANGGKCSVREEKYWIPGVYGTLPEPKWSGHVFLGWFTAASGGREVTAEDTVTTAAKRTLFARWTDRQTTIFRGNGGTPSTQRTTNTIYSVYGELPTATRSGHVLVGWYTAAEGGKQVYTNSTVTLAAERTLFAHWSDQQVVTFKGNGGTPSTQKTTNTIYAKYGSFPSVEWANHVFLGWYTAAAAAEGKRIYTNSTVTLAGKRTLWAQWSNQQVVTFRGNGGTPDVQRATNTMGKAYGTLPTPKRSGHVFLGWFTAAEGGTKVKGTDKATAATERTLWAHWTDQQVTVFKGNGGGPSTQRTTNTIYAKYGDLPTATRSGHVLVGWYTAADGGKQVYADSTVTLAAERTLFAHWSDQQVVTFKGNGGTPSTQKTTNTIYAKYGSFPSVEWANHVFQGWYTAANAAEGKRIYTNSTVTLAGKRTLWAQWEDRQVVTFRGNGGTPDVQRATNTMGKTYGTLPTPKRSGHVFLGWFTEEAGGSKVKGTDKVTAATARTLWAHWTDRQVTVFKGNGGSPKTQTTTNTIYADYGELPTATRSGHVLAGWYTAAEGGKRVYTNSTVTLAAERTLYAQWTDQQVTTFKGNGGTPSTQNTTNTIYAKYGTFPAVEWTNHVFLGWYTTANEADGKRIYTNSTVTLAAARTLYAQWTNRQVVTFEGNGGTPETKKTTNTMGKAYGTLPTPKWSGHVFLGWFTEAESGTEVQGTDKATAATARTLYAHWTDRQVTVFKGNGGTPETQATTNTIYADYGELPTAKRSGQALAGWFTAPEGGKRVYTNSTVTLAAERTLYAQWTDKQVTTFKGNGGTPATQKTTNTIYSAYGYLPTATWSGHVFQGWYNAAEGGKRVYTNSTVTLAATRTLYAHWTTAKGFAITAIAVGADGGDDGPAPRTVRGEDKAENVCRLRFELSEGTEYEIQWTASLDGEWETVERLTAESDGEVEVEIEVPGGEKGFFRLVAFENTLEAD